MRKIYTAIAGTAFMIGSYAGYAQDDIVREFAKIQQAYKKSASLSFSIKYLYSTAQNPSEYKDSATGYFKIKGASSWGRLNDTEYVTNKEYQITIYPQNNLMMLDKADQEALQFLSLDSIFQTPDKFTFTSPAKGHVHVAFTLNPLYKSADIFYDPKTYLLQHMKYVMQPSEEFSEEEGVKTEGLVQIVFSNYSFDSFDEAIFSTKKYIVKKGKEYMPAQGYSGYSVYLASSKLLN